MPLPFLVKGAAKLAPVASNFIRNRLVRASAKAAIGGAAGGAAAFGAQRFADRMSAPPPRSPFGSRAGSRSSSRMMLAPGERPKRKRINYTNVTALRRSVSRLKGFADLSERTMKQIARTLPAKTRRAARAAACRPKC